MTGLQPWRLFKALEYLHFLQRNMKTIAVPSRRRNLGEKTMINVIESIRRWHRRSSTVDALYRLDDRMLADIGLVRGNLKDATRHLR